MENRTYVSLSHQGGNKNQMFRPNQPTFMILPNISMIMYDLFWSKYFFYLRKEGFDFSDHSALSRTLYSTKECNLDYKKIPGIISQCAIITNNGGEVDTFDRFLSNGPSGWLFQETQWVHQYLSIVSKLVDKEYKEASNNLKSLMGNNFKELLKQEYTEYDNFFKEISKEIKDENNVIILLSNEIGKRMKEKYHKGFPLWPNYLFTVRTLCRGIIELSTSQHQVLANNTYHKDGVEGLSIEEQKALLILLSKTALGKIILSSMFIDKYYSTKSDKNHGFNNCYLTIRENKELILKEIKETLNINLPENVLIETAFGWDLNMFLYSGEYSARHIFKKYTEYYEIEKTQLKKELDEKIKSTYVNDSNQRYKLFLNDLKDKEMYKLLNYTIKQHENTNRSYFSNFLEKLKFLIENKKNYVETFMSLATLNQNVTYDGTKLSFQNFDYSEPVYTGYDAFKRWREGILKVK